MRPARLVGLVGGGLVNAEASAWVSRIQALGANPVGGSASAVDTMISGLKSDGTWASVADLYLFAGVDVIAGTVAHIKSGLGANATLTGSSVLTYVPTGPDLGINDYSELRYLVAGGNAGPYAGISLGAISQTAFSAYGLWGGATTGKIIHTLSPGGVHPSIQQANKAEMWVRLYSDTDIFSGAGQLVGDVLACRQAGNAQRAWLNGTQWADRTSAMASTPGAGDTWLMWSAAGQAGGRRIAAYFRAPGVTYTQALSIRTRINAMLSALGYQATGNITYNYIGDSLTAGSGSGETPYPRYLMNKPGWSGRHANVARGGAYANQAASVIDGLTGGFRPDPTYSTKTLAFVWYGTNDLGGSVSAATTLTNLRTIWAQCRTNGCRVIAFTIAPRADTGWTGAMETQRQALNASIIADSANYDALIRVDALFTDPTNTMLYNADKLHFTSAGESLIADTIAAQINPATL